MFEGTRISLCHFLRYCDTKLRVGGMTQAFKNCRMHIESAAFGIEASRNRTNDNVRINN